MVYGVSNRKEEFHNDEMDHRYVKHPKDKHQLIIDPDAAEIVKLIFSLFLKGTSKRAIALYLNEHGVPSPSAYKLQKGIPVSNIPAYSTMGSEMCIRDRYTRLKASPVKNGWKYLVRMSQSLIMKPLIRYRLFYSVIPVLLQKAGKSTCSAVF